MSIARNMKRGLMMSEKRFEVSFDEKRIFDIYAVNKNTTEYDIHKSCDLINSLYEENEQLRKELDSFKPVIFQDMRKGTVILYSKGDNNE